MIIKMNGSKWLIHYRWVMPYSSNCSCCGYPVISYLEKVEE